MRACSRPGATSRLTPRRISRSSTATWRSTISSGLGGGGVCLGHGRHCNNTTAVVEIYRVGRWPVRGLSGRGRARRPPRSRATMASPEKRSSTRRRQAAGSRVSTRPIISTRSSSPSRRKPGDAVVDELGRRAPVGGDDRRPARHGLDHHEPERLGPADREHHRARPPEQLDLLVVRHVLVQLDVGGEERLDLAVEVLALGRLAALQEHVQRQPGPAGDRDRLLGSLVGVGATDVHERVFLLRPELVGRQVDAVVDGARVGHVEVARPLRVADRDEVHVPGRAASTAAGSASVHGPCSVCTTGGLPCSNAPQIGPTMPA